MWTGYWRDIWKKVDSQGVDSVFVDGRFRVACTLNSLLQVGAETVVAIHDFWNRPRYHVVLPFLIPVCRAGSLGVFVPKADFERTELERLLEHYALN